MRNVLYFLIITFFTSSAFAHRGGGGISGIGFIANEALAPKKFAWVFLPTHEHDQDTKRTIYPFGFIANLGNQWYVFVRTELYEVHRFTDEDQKKQAKGYSDTDVAVLYNFKRKLFDKLGQVALINFHIPTGSLKKDLSDGFIKYEPTYVLTYNRELPQKTTLQFFNQNGLRIWQRVQNQQHDPLTHQAGDEEPTAYSFIWNAGFALINEINTSSLELDWENNRWNYGDRNDLYLTPRAFFDLSRMIRIGVSVPVGLTQSADRYKLIGYIEIGY